MTAPKLSKLFSIYWIYTSLFFVSSFSLETKHTINQSVKCIISTDSNVCTRMNLSTTLSVKNITS